MEQLTLLEDDFGRRLVYQHNNLIQACYDLTVTEKKIFVACAAMVNSRETLSADTPFTFTLAEAKQILGLSDNKRHWEEYEKACSSLMDKKFTIYDQASDTKTEGVFAHTAKYEYTKKRFTLYFSTAIIPYLSSLNTHFTKYRLLHIGRLSSKYAQLMYEYMVMKLNEQKVKAWSETFNLADLRKVLNCQDIYKEYKDLRTRVITPAIDQVSEQTDIEVTFEVTKEGRKVAYVTLDFKFKEEWIQAEEDLKNERYVLSREQIDKIKSSSAFKDKYLPAFAKKKAKEDGKELKNPQAYIFDFLKFADDKLQNDPTYYADFRNYLSD